MSDLLIYWRDYLQNKRDGLTAGRDRVWHSSSRLLASLEPGDRLWLVSSGQGLGLTPPHLGWLVEVWTVVRAAANPGDDAHYPPDRYRFRVLARNDDAAAADLPRPIDACIRPAGSPASAPIGRLLQGPRRLAPGAVSALHAAVDLSGRPSLPGVALADSRAPRTAFAGGDALDPQRIALGIRQPWAELILRGIKSIEVRTLETNVRGPVYLYTSKVLADIPAAQQALATHRLDPATLQRAAIVGSVEIIDCRPCSGDDAAAACVPPSLLKGKRAWVLGRPERLAAPVQPRFLPYGVWFYPFQRRNGRT